MNPFRSSNPNLSSSDRTRDKKSKYIYAVAKKKFQSGKRCGTKNIKYYKKGTVRSVANYKLQQDLARGNVLCEDCNDRGNLCGSINPSILTRVHMHNSSLSEFYGGGTLVADISSVKQGNSFPVIQSDVSGVWGPGTTIVEYGPKTDLSNAVLSGSDPSLNMPFGYLNNLINIPRNLDGSGITIDPSNILFASEDCGVHSFFRNNTTIKTNVVVRGGINLSGYPDAVPILGSDLFLSNDDCDASYNVFKNSFIQFAGLIDATPEGIFFGKIFNICCIGKNFGIPWFDIYIEIYSVNDYDLLSKMINYTPSFQNGLLDISNSSQHYKWDNIPRILGYLIYSQNSEKVVSITSDGYIESVRIFQGTCNNNQTTGNKVDQSYMSCLEDGTKKIKFT